MYSENFVLQTAAFMNYHLKERLKTEDEFGGFIPMPKPRNKFESWGVWSEISSFLAPEVIAQDGEASEDEQNHHIQMVLKDAEVIYDMGYPCPIDIRAFDDTGFLDAFLSKGGDDVY